MIKLASDRPFKGVNDSRVPDNLGNIQNGAPVCQIVNSVENMIRGDRQFKQ